MVLEQDSNIEFMILSFISQVHLFPQTWNIFRPMLYSYRFKGQIYSFNNNHQKLYNFWPLLPISVWRYTFTFKCNQRLCKRKWLNERNLKIYQKLLRKSIVLLAKVDQLVSDWKSYGEQVDDYIKSIMKTIIIFEDIWELPKLETLRFQRKAMSRVKRLAFGAALLLDIFEDSKGVSEKLRS